MSYQTYTTEALVCGSFLHNTADKVFLLFTREAGMLYATAKSVREERSKQRFALQDFSLINVSLIKGKQGWRVGSVEVEMNYFAKAEGRSARGSVVLLFKTLRRFIHDEEPLQKLFDFCLEALKVISQENQQRSFLDGVDKNNLPEGIEKANFSDLVNYQNDLSVPKLEKLIEKAIANSHL